MANTILLVITILLFLGGCASVPETRHKPVAHLKEYGVFAPTIQSGVATDTIFKDIDYVSNPKLLSRTTRIPCKQGTRFGVLFDLDGIPEDGNTKTVTIHWSFPEMVSPEGRKATSSVFTWPVGLTKEDWKDLYFDWGLEEGFELVAGDWTISVYYESVLILQQPFIVEKCEQETREP
jgi:hypothetical protein